MCWAGLERIERIRKLGYLAGLPFEPANERLRAEVAVKKAVVGGILRNGPKDESLDSALALLPVLRFPQPEVATRTIEEIRRTLSADGGLGAYLYRYTRRDDFGQPHSAFVICSFWIAQGLAQLGRTQEARGVLEHLLRAANPVGLYSEHFMPGSNRQLGNFPQAYSHVGLINAAFAASPPWSQVL
jgi:GH15 family glucan-1,4-alpha-glucosidase